MKKVICVIPARYGSSRFPGKPLAMIQGKPMIQWVYERCQMAKCVSQVIVATDDLRIHDTVVGFGGQAVMTGECKCGSDRVYEACKDMDFDIVINVQGDEPLVNPTLLDQLSKAFNDPEVRLATLKTKVMDSNEIDKPNVIKLITDNNDDAIYFSRSRIPYNRDDNENVVYYKHIGIYAYKKDFLKAYVEMKESDLENAEKLEQLRVLENGYKIRVVETDYQTVAVDLPEHIELVEKKLREENK